MKTRLVSLTWLVVAASSPALAQEAPPVSPAGGWSFGLGAATDNKSKDVSKSGGEPFVWALAEWSSEDGTFYAGPAVETVESNGSRLEAAVYAGWRPQVMGFDLDLNVEHKWLVDADPGTDDAAFEFTADVSRAVGPVEGRLRVQHTPDSTGSRKSWTWHEARISWDQTSDLTWSGSLGRREQEVGLDYVGWNLGATWRLGQRFELDARWHDTNVEGPIPPGDDEAYAGRFVIGAAAFF
jgi:uncharacterized protein (TIGR02001 family)